MLAGPVITSVFAQTAPLRAYVQPADVEEPIVLLRASATRQPWMFRVRFKNLSLPCAWP
jgi:hypothetical protein